MKTGQVMKRWSELPVGAIAAAAQPAIASHVGCFSPRFPSAEASDTPILRLRLSNPNKVSSFASASASPSPSSYSYSYSYADGGVVTIPIQTVKAEKLQPKPELGLLSLFFVLSMAFGALISLALVSIPTLNAFRRLAASVDQLSNVVSDEVPGTLTSLKLSGLEIHQLTQQLKTLKQTISPSSYSKKNRRSSSSMSSPTSNGDSPTKNHHKT
ncbi:hypothetical protein PanWU01x14_120390 [Parasponia andersonii]|uniref:Transmembrane protein n=1 Tax=Parasponia andersonii TaxID=3476 RepID=A0A2P5CUZ1_PARAD|nr:hypothetical protein PanWU01x14_120390 [Parasponia andersonii]